MIEERVTIDGLLYSIRVHGGNIEEPQVSEIKPHKAYDKYEDIYVFQNHFTYEPIMAKKDSILN